MSVYTAEFLKHIRDHLSILGNHRRIDSISSWFWFFSV